LRLFYGTTLLSSVTFDRWSGYSSFLLSTNQNYNTM
jgi:hypothetical protein